MRFLVATIGMITLASCVPAPVTLNQATSHLHNSRSYPMCSRSSSNGLSASFIKPAVEMGHGMIASVVEGSAEGTSIRAASVVDCESGYGLLIEELGDPLFSDSPDFKSMLEQRFADYSRDQSLDNIVAVASRANSDGLKALPWVYWAGGMSKDEECACQLYYPKVKRQWFDQTKVGPDYPKNRGSNPTSLADLELRLSTARQRASEAYTSTPTN